MQKAYKFDLVPLAYFCFYFFCLMRPKKTLMQFILENVLPVLFHEFNGVMSYI